MCSSEDSRGEVAGANFPGSNKVRVAVIALTEVRLDSIGAFHVGEVGDRENCVV